jgi:hypothetical protein
MSFKDDLHRHRERERQGRADDRHQAESQKQAQERVVHENRAWTKHVCDHVVLPLLKDFAEEYGQKGSASNVSEPIDGPDQKRCSLTWIDDEQESFAVIFTITRNTVHCVVKYSGGVMTENAITIASDLLNCSQAGDDELAKWVQLQLMNAATIIDQRCESRRQ